MAKEEPVEKPFDDVGVAIDSRTRKAFSTIIFKEGYSLETKERFAVRTFQAACERYKRHTLRNNWLGVSAVILTTAIGAGVVRVENVIKQHEQLQRNKDAAIAIALAKPAYLAALGICPSDLTAQASTDASVGNGAAAVYRLAAQREAADPTINCQTLQFSFIPVELTNGATYVLQRTDILPDTAFSGGMVVGP